ncbi:MAG: hypothetical protein ABIQ70_10800 [Dokdonella sp.]
MQGRCVKVKRVAMLPSSIVALPVSSMHGSKSAQRWCPRERTLLPSPTFRASPRNLALRILLRAFVAARYAGCSRWRSLRERALLPGPAFRASPSNPALGFLPWAFISATGA